jgi:hypothetical protein
VEFDAAVPDIWRRLIDLSSVADEIVVVLNGLGGNQRWCRLCSLRCRFSVESSYALSEGSYTSSLDFVGDIDGGEMLVLVKKSHAYWSVQT